MTGIAEVEAAQPSKQDAPQAEEASSLGEKMEKSSVSAQEYDPADFWLTSAFTAATRMPAVSQSSKEKTRRIQETSQIGEALPGRWDFEDQPEASSSQLRALISNKPSAIDCADRYGVLNGLSIIHL